MLLGLNTVCQVVQNNYSDEESVMSGYDFLVNMLQGGLVGVFKSLMVM